MSKCIPCLLYGLDACPINKTDGNSLIFTVRRSLFKVFHTTSQSIILDCQLFFNFPDITVWLQQRKCKFLTKFMASENTVCHSLRSFAQCELSSIYFNIVEITLIFVHLTLCHSFGDVMKSFTSRNNRFTSTVKYVKDSQFTILGLSDVI